MNNAYTLEDVYRRGIPNCTHGCLILLPKEIIVVDIDDHDAVMDWERRVPEFTNTVACSTKKGKHSYFRRTAQCDEVGILDGARQLTAADGEVIPIDIKTVTSTGTRGLISVPPSPNKVWERALGEHAVLDMPQDFVEFIKLHKKKNTPSSRSVVKKALPTSSSNHVEEARNLLLLISPRRADNYPDWIELGWCLHNISASGLLQDWVGFSRNSSKFQEGECERRWVSRSHGLTVWAWVLCTCGHIRIV